MKIKSRDFIRNQVIVAVVIFVILFFLQVPPLLGLPLYAVLLGAAGGYVLPRFYLGRRRKKYQNKFLDELPNAVEAAIVRGVKSGLALNDLDPPRVQGSQGAGEIRSSAACSTSRRWANRWARPP